MNKATLQNSFYEKEGQQFPLDILRSSRPDHTLASVIAAINETPFLEDDNQDVIDGVGGGGDPEATVEKQDAEKDTIQETKGKTIPLKCIAIVDEHLVMRGCEEEATEDHSADQAVSTGCAQPLDQADDPGK